MKALLVEPRTKTKIALRAFRSAALTFGTIYQSTSVLSPPSTVFATSWKHTCSASHTTNNLAIPAPPTLCSKELLTHSDGHLITARENINVELIDWLFDWYDRTRFEHLRHILRYDRTRFEHLRHLLRYDRTRFEHLRHIFRYDRTRFRSGAITNLIWFRIKHFFTTNWKLIRQTPSFKVG